MLASGCFMPGWVSHLVAAQAVQRWLPYHVRRQPPHAGCTPVAGPVRRRLRWAPLLSHGWSDVHVLLSGTGAWQHCGVVDFLIGYATQPLCSPVPVAPASVKRIRLFEGSPCKRPRCWFQTLCRRCHLHQLLHTHLCGCISDLDAAKIRHSSRGSSRLCCLACSLPSFSQELWYL